MIWCMYVLGILIDTEDFTANNTNTVSALRVQMWPLDLRHGGDDDECGPQAMNNLLLEKP